MSDNIATQLAADQLRLQEAQLEALMRIYDAIGALLVSVEGNRNKWDGLREQHRQGTYYFPPFSIAEHGEVEET